MGVLVVLILSFERNLGHSHSPFGVSPVSLFSILFVFVLQYTSISLQFVLAQLRAAFRPAFVNGFLIC